MRLVCLYCSYTRSEGGFRGQVRAQFPVIVNMESAAKSPTELPQEQPRTNVPIPPLMVLEKACLCLLPGKVQKVLNLSGFDRMSQRYSGAEVTRIKSQLYCEY